SSRNRNLTPEQRKNAPEIYKALQQAVELLKDKKPAVAVKGFITSHLDNIEGIEVEYFEISDFETLQPVNELSERKTALCIAAFMGKTRLIDNVIV
ncbi:MAG: hypothetical protein RLZZ306_90, partial [Bacteroidota bacterium]